MACRSMTTWRMRQRGACRSPSRASTAASFAPPEKVLGRVVDLFPGGERLDDPALRRRARHHRAGQGQDHGRRGASCSGPIRRRTRRRATISADPLLRQKTGPSPSSHGSQAPTATCAATVCCSASILGHPDGNGSEIEPRQDALGGPRLIDPLSGPEIYVNDGSLKRPLRAAAHEFGHLLGALHADRDPTCGGNANGQGGRALAARRSRSPAGHGLRGRTRAAPQQHARDLNTHAKPLYDLMSYCGDESSAWLSPYNWNRFFAAMRAIRKANAVTACTARATVRASVSGAAFVVGTVGPVGPRSRRWSPPTPPTAYRHRMPDPLVPVRARDAADAQSAEIGATGANGPGRVLRRGDVRRAAAGADRVDPTRSPRAS